LTGIFNKNPPLHFEASGKFDVNSGVLLWGAMLGTWENAFGFKGFNLSNVIAEIGFNPTACAYGCISDFGIGLGFNIGSTEISFDGNIAFPDMWNIYLAGSISKKSPNKNLAIRDVIHKWNSIDPNKPVDNNVPADWAVTGASFFFAPEAGQFGPIHYERGFGVTGHLELLSMDVYLSLNCTGEVLQCNFAFDVSLQVSTFTTMIAKEIGLMYPNNERNIIWKLHDVTLTDWSQANVAQAVDPRWRLNLDIFDSPHHLDFRVKQYELSSSFHDFFKQWLKHLF